MRINKLGIRKKHKMMGCCILGLCSSHQLHSLSPTSNGKNSPISPTDPIHRLLLNSRKPIFHPTVVPTTKPGSTDVVERAAVWDATSQSNASSPSVPATYSSRPRNKSSSPIAFASAYQVRKGGPRSRVRGEKAIQRSGRALSVCYNTRVPLRCGWFAIPLRSTLSSKHVQRGKGEKARRCRGCGV
jgi:hypothetical protein